MSDLIANQIHPPAFEELTGFMPPPARGLWQSFNNHLQTQHKFSAKITYSACVAKLGWNTKYQKSGKSLCTLVPEKECCTALVVLPVDLGEVAVQKVKSRKYISGRGGIYARWR
jgi:hypothetical protein